MKNNLQVSILFVPLQSLTRGEYIGEMAEWSNAAVLKTVDLHGSGGSNPSLSAEKWLTDICRPLFVCSIPKNGPNSGELVPLFIYGYYIES